VEIINNTKSSAHFGKYGKSFQEKIFQAFMTDREWAAQMVEIMNPTFFEVSYLQYLSERFFSYYTKYKCFPTLGLLVTIIKEDLSQKNDAILRDQIVAFLHRTKANPHSADLGYVKDKTLDFCRKQAFKEALEESVEQIQTENFESVLSIMRKAVSVGLPSSTGHDFFEDAESRFIKINRRACPTGLPKLDTKDILRGGLGRGEIGVITANTGVGKSHWLVAMGANAMRVGKNVLHYTFELTEHAVGLRYDANLCDIDSNEIQDRKEDVLKKYEGMELGRLIIKEYPTGSASAITIRNHIEKLMLKGFVPSIIIIDYADIMRSTKSYDSLRHELKLIYEELRNLAMELNVPIWTASQANRESAKSDIVGLENMSEAYGKAMVADVVISLSRKPTEKSTDAGRLFVAKNRAGKDGIVFPLKIDTAKSTFEILDESVLTLNEAVTQTNTEMKDILRQKWKEVNGTNN
jgi:replicative DNA helicase